MRKPGPLLCALATALAPSAFAKQPTRPALCTLDRATGTTIDRDPLIKNGYGAQWSPVEKLIVYMHPDAAGYYRLYTVSPDGRAPHALLDRSLPGLPLKRHQGIPSWHPSGRYILFTAEKAGWKGRTLFGIPDYGALPGFGVHDDLWIMKSDGSKVWRLTHEPDTKNEGILMPLFSPDGRRVAWSQRLPGKLSFALKVADFVQTPEPHLANVHTYRPGGPAYYETGGFTSDGKGLTYTSDQDTHSFWHSQIYALDLATGKTRRLTKEGRYYNEHPRVVSTPTGDWVVYMSTRGSRRRLHRRGTDWYAVRYDGTGRKRLTEMNLDRKGNPENVGHPQVACVLSPGPDGVFLGDVQDSLIEQTGMVRIVRLTCPGR